MAPFLDRALKCLPQYHCRYGKCVPQGAGGDMGVPAVDQGAAKTGKGGACIIVGREPGEGECEGDSGCSVGPGGDTRLPSLLVVALLLLALGRVRGQR